MLHSTFKRKPKKRVVSRSFRIPPEVDRALDAEARHKGWTKSFLLREIITNWFSFHTAKKPPRYHREDMGPS